MNFLIEYLALLIYYDYAQTKVGIDTPVVYL